MAQEQPGNSDDQARNHAIIAVIDDVRMARAAGKDVDDQAIIQAYPHLMPELAAELEKLRRIEAARAAAVAPADVAADSDAQEPSDTFSELPSSTETADEDAEPPVPLQRVPVRAPGYSILREINRGGQAVVYQAIQLSTGRKVALKVMRDGPLASERALARFKREVGVLAALNHPNIVTIFDTGITLDGSRYLAMDYIGGRSLDEYVKERHRKREQDPSWLLRLFLKICAAVSAAHLRGVVHRDLKPSNIRIDDRGEPHILDFGLARTALDAIAQNGNEPLSITGEFLGSLPWSSPEQAEGDPDKIDIRTDVYSLGVILYQMITGGHFPYVVVGNIRDILNNILTVEPTPPSKIVATSKDHRTVPPRLPLVNEVIEKIVLKALAKKRENRYQSAAEMGREVASYLSGLPTPVGGSAPLLAREYIPANRPGRSMRPLIILALLTVVVAAAGGSWLFFRGRGAGRTGDSTVATNANGNQQATAKSTSQPAAIDLIDRLKHKNVELDRHWRWEGSTLTSDMGAARLSLHYVPGDEEYDFHVEFSRISGHLDEALIMSHGTADFAWNIAGPTNQTMGIDTVNGLRAPQTDTAYHGDSILTNGQRYSAVVQVRRNMITTYLDGQLINQQPTDYSNVSLWPGMVLDDPGLGFVSWHSPTTIYKAEVTEITGHASTPPPTPPAMSNPPQLQVVTTAPLSASPAPAVEPSSPQIPAEAAAFGGHHFSLFTEQLSWDQAAARCKQMGGHLASPKDADAMAFLQKLKGDSTIAWIGGSADAFGNWNWQDGTLIPAAEVSVDPQHPEYHWIFQNSRGKLSTRPQDGHIDGAAYPDVQGFICEWDQ